MIEETWKDRFDKLDGNPIAAAILSNATPEEVQTLVRGQIRIFKDFIEKELDLQLDRYTKFLLKHNYTDDDVWSEKPTAIDRYLESIKKEKSWD